jgi:HAD superfamily hydrolase (TIGR01509 family)
MPLKVARLCGDQLLNCGLLMQCAELIHRGRIAVLAAYAWAGRIQRQISRMPLAVPAAGSPSLKKPGAVIFDMDGVLFDTERLYQEAALIVGKDVGCAIPAGLLERVIGLSWPGTRALFAETFGPSFLLDEFIAGRLRQFEELAAARLSLKPRARELISTLEEFAIPRAIATGSARGNVEQHLAAHSLANRFHAIVAHGDYAAGKPAPDPFLIIRAAERLAVDPRLCIAIEDSYNGVRSAAAAGVITIMVPDLVAPSEEIQALCVHVMRDVSEVEELIRPAGSAGPCSNAHNTMKATAACGSKPAMSNCNKFLGRCVAPSSPLAHTRWSWIKVRPHESARPSA